MDFSKLGPIAIDSILDRLTNTEEENSLYFGSRWDYILQTVTISGESINLDPIAIVHEIYVKKVSDIGENGFEICAKGLTLEEAKVNALKLVYSIAPELIDNAMKGSD